MLKSDRLRDLACLQALDAHGDPPGGAVNYSPDALQVGKEPAGCDAGDLQADAAFFLGHAAPDDRPARDRLFAAYFAYF